MCGFADNGAVFCIYTMFAFNAVSLDYKYPSLPLNGFRRKYSKLFVFPYSAYRKAAPIMGAAFLCFLGREMGQYRSKISNGFASELYKVPVL